MLSDNLVEKILKVVKSGCDMLPTLTVSFIGGLNLPLSGICSSLTETLIKVRPDKTVQVTNQTEYDCFRDFVLLRDSPGQAVGHTDWYSSITLCQPSWRFQVRILD